MPSQTSKKKATSAAGWKGKKALATTLELPSGNVCKVRRVSIAKLLSEEVFPDELSALIQDTVSDKSGKKSIAKESASASVKDMGKFMDAIDKVAVLVIAEPKVVRPVDENGKELDDDDRDPEKLYTDDVDLEDKIFVFQYAVGGGSDLNTFRSELAAGVGSVPDVQAVEGSPV